MGHKLLMTGAAGLVAVGLGAGIGIAAAEPDSTPSPAHEATWSMDQMHASMREHMPDDLAAECDRGHAGMSESMHGGRSKATGPASGAHMTHRS